MKLTIQSNDRTCTTEFPFDDINTDDLCEAFKGLLVAYGYKENSVIHSMADIVELSTERE